jgi:DNA-binding NarL/FixJ family response regulator
MSNLEEHEPDIFLIDYRLPEDKSGIDLAIEILENIPQCQFFS